MEIAGTLQRIGDSLEGKAALHALGLWLDGNVVQLAEVRRDPKTGRIVVVGLVSHEDDRLLEGSERLSHPIFTDMRHVFYPDPERVASIVTKLLKKLRPGTLKTVGCMSGETVRIYQSLSDPDSENPFVEYAKLLSQAHIKNPLLYPLFFTFRHSESVTPDGRDQLQLSVIQYSETKAFLDLMNHLPVEPIALSNSRQALTAVASLLGEPNAGGGVLLTDIGRMRTHYVGATPARMILNHTIPMGFARADRHIFRALPLKMRDILTLAASGSTPLLLPSDQTPPPLFDPAYATPQIECTHAALQIARYLARACERLEQALPTADGRLLTLSGLPSRLPGFRRYIQAKAECRLVRPENLPNCPFKFANPEDRRRYADFLIPLGSTLHALGGPTTGLTFVPQGRTSVSLGGRVNLERIQPGLVYRVDQPFEIV